jgi:hypothetical protein
MRTKFYSVNLKGRDHLKYLDSDGYYRNRKRGLDWIDLPQDGDQRLFLVITAINLRVS